MINISRQFAQSSGSPEQVWDIDLTTTYALAHTGHAVSDDGEVRFFIDDHRVSDMELTMSLGPKFTESLRNARTEEEHQSLMEAIGESAALSPFSIWERHRLNAVSKLEINSDQVRELKEYATNVTDRVTILEDSVPSDEKQRDVARTLQQLDLSRIFELGETFLVRAWADQRFFKRFREFGITLEDLLEIEREEKEIDHDPRLDGESPHSAILMALETGGLCPHFNGLIFDQGLAATDRVINDQKRRDRNGARLKYLAALGVIALGVTPSALTQYQLGGVFGVWSALLFISGLSQSAKAINGMKVDREIVSIYANIASHSHAQGNMRNDSPEVSLVEETPLGAKLRNHHKIVECGAAIDALNLFGLSYNQISASIPSARYDGFTSRNHELRQLLWKQCQAWGISTLGEFRTVYRALHTRRRLENKIEKALFANFAADVLLENE